MNFLNHLVSIKVPLLHYLLVSKHSIHHLIRGKSMHSYKDFRTKFLENCTIVMTSALINRSINCFHFCTSDHHLCNFLINITTLKIFIFYEMIDILLIDNWYKKSIPFYMKLSYLYGTFISHKFSKCHLPNA